MRAGRRSSRHGAVVIAAITSCTNTSNPSVMLGAGLVASKAVARGLEVPPYVKTSLAPGSKVVTEYLRTVRAPAPTSRPWASAWSATAAPPASATAGPLPPEAGARRSPTGKLVAAAVLSGNRNFEGRINPDVKANYLASPPLVVAYALAGTTDIDLTTEPIGTARDGKPVCLTDIWPTQKEIAELEARDQGGDVRGHLRQRVRRQPRCGTRSRRAGGTSSTSARTRPTSRSRRSSSGSRWSPLPSPTSGMRASSPSSAIP